MPLALARHIIRYDTIRSDDDICSTGSNSNSTGIKWALRARLPSPQRSARRNWADFFKVIIDLKIHPSFLLLPLKITTLTLCTPSVFPTSISSSSFPFIIYEDLPLIFVLIRSFFRFSTFFLSSLFRFSSSSSPNYVDLNYIKKFPISFPFST